MSQAERYRLPYPAEGFYVDVRAVPVHGVWLACADTPDGPSLGWGDSRDEAMRKALAPFDGATEVLLAQFQPPEAST